jgi:TetR/AcrR family transcriptional repressor of lmrAB and yxaGH operons
MVRAMGRLLRRQGYAATGLQQVAREARAPIGSMYFYFPDGKEQLAAEAVSRSGGDLGRGLAALLEASDISAAVRAIAGAMGEDLVRSRWMNGCPIATAALERAADSEPIRGAASAVFDQWETLFFQRMCADGIAPERARRIASLIVAALEGAILLARTRRSVGPLEEVADQVAEWVATETARCGPAQISSPASAPSEKKPT